MTAPAQEVWPDLQDSLQIVVVANCYGTVRHAQDNLRGGRQDLVESRPYEAGEVIGEIIPDAAGAMSASFCLMISNQRMTNLVPGRESLWSGWHARQRIWRLGEEPPQRTFLALGICELLHALRGADCSCSEMLWGSPEPVQLVMRDDVPLVTTARVALEQLTRTQSDCDLIWRDLQSGLSGSECALSPDDWMVAGCLGKMLTDNAIVDSFPVVSVQGMTVSEPADCVVMSMMAENPIQLRHKRLGYHMNIHGWIFRGLPDAVQQWVKRSFEQVKVTVDELERDYVALCERLRKSGRQLCILNNIASHRGERIDRYHHLRGALEERLTSFRNLTLNLMAERLAESDGLKVVDVDAMAAELGIRYHSPDRVHHGPLLEHRIRGELVRLAGQRL